MYYNQNAETVINKPQKLVLSNGRTIMGDIPDAILLAEGIYPYVAPIFDDKYKLGAVVVTEGVATHEVIKKTQDELDDDKDKKDKDKVKTANSGMLSLFHTLIECLINKGVITGEEPEIVGLMSEYDKIKGV